MRFKNGIEEQNVVVKCGADSVLPFALTFGFFVIFFGTSSSGGGFQGGVLVSAAVILIYLGYGNKTVNTVINSEFIRINEAIGAIIYVCLGMCGLFAGGLFCENIFYKVFNVGDPLSAGNITYMSFAVGYKVLTGVGFLLLLMIGLLALNSGEEADA